MVYNELPVLEEVIADGPFLNQCITECQLHSTEFYECLTTTENTIRDSVLTGKEYNKYVKNLSVALEDAADILPDHTTALEKVRILIVKKTKLFPADKMTVTKLSCQRFPYIQGGPKVSGQTLALIAKSLSAKLK